MVAVRPSRRNATVARKEVQTKKGQQDDSSVSLPPVVLCGSVRCRLAGNQSLQLRAACDMGKGLVGVTRPSRGYSRWVCSVVRSNVLYESLSQGWFRGRSRPYSHHPPNWLRSRARRSVSPAQRHSGRLPYGEVGLHQRSERVLFVKDRCLSLCAPKQKAGREKRRLCLSARCADIKKATDSVGVLPLCLVARCLWNGSGVLLPETSGSLDVSYHGKGFLSRARSTDRLTFLSRISW